MSTGGLNQLWVSEGVTSPLHASSAVAGQYDTSLYAEHEDSISVIGGKFTWETAERSALSK